MSTMSEHNGIFFTKKQASVLVATLITLGVLIFVLGYFFGKKSDIEMLIEKTEQDVLADRAEYNSTMESFVAQHGNIDDDNDDEKVPDATEEDNKQELANNPKSLEVPKEEAVGSAWVAALAGFGTKSAAVAMMQRLKRHGIEVVLKTKTSSTARKKIVRYWYQVVTQPYADSEELDDLIARIIKLEHIKKSDVKVIQL